MTRQGGQCPSSTGAANQQEHEGNHHLQGADQPQQAADQDPQSSGTVPDQSPPIFDVSDNEEQEEQGQVDLNTLPRGVALHKPKRTIHF